MILLRFGVMIIDLLMGEPHTPHFYGLGILGRFQTPQANIIDRLRHQATTSKQKNKIFTGTFNECYFYKSQTCGHP